MKIHAFLTIDFDAPDGSDAWEMVRWCVSGAVHSLARKECREIKPDIVSVTVDGRAYKPKSAIVSPKRKQTALATRIVTAKSPQQVDRDRRRAPRKQRQET